MMTKLSWGGERRELKTDRFCCMIWVAGLGKSSETHKRDLVSHVNFNGASLIATSRI